MKEQSKPPEATRSPATEKRPYRRPRILARETLEAMAVDCSSAPPGLTAKDNATCTFSFS